MILERFVDDAYGIEIVGVQHQFQAVREVVDSVLADFRVDGLSTVVAPGLLADTGLLGPRSYCAVPVA